MDACILRSTAVDGLWSSSGSSCGGTARHSAGWCTALADESSRRHCPALSARGDRAPYRRDGIATPCKYRGEMDTLQGGESMKSRSGSHDAGSASTGSCTRRAGTCGHRPTAMRRQPRGRNSSRPGSASREGVDRADSLAWRTRHLCQRRRDIDRWPVDDVRRRLDAPPRSSVLERSPSHVSTGSDAVGRSTSKLPDWAVIDTEGQSSGPSSRARSWPPTSSTSRGGFDPARAE